MINNKVEDAVVRKKYRPQFKVQAFERAAIEVVAQVSKDLGMKESMLNSWRAQKQGGNSIKNQKLQQAKVSQLKRKVS